MYTLCLAGIIGLGLGATGCGPGGRGGQDFDVAWSLYQPGTGTVTCSAAGVAKVHLDVQNIYTAAAYHDAFPCSAYGGTSQILPADDYSVALRAYDSSSSLVSEWVSQISYPIYLNTTTYLPAVELDLAAPAPQGGNFDAVWSLYLAGGSSVTCSDAGVTEVHLDVQSLTTGVAYHDTFACSAFAGTSQVLPAGNYSVALRAYDASGTQVSEWVSSSSCSIYAGVVTPLPDVALTI
jgi:hypothetical protein